MATTKTRFLHTNLVQAAATVLYASSSQVGNPVAWLKDQLRTKTWRSALGWTIVAGFNDKIDYNRSGNKTATIAPGTYAVAADLCAAIVAGLEAADPTPVWACTYDTSTFKFTISSDIAFILLISSGGNGDVNAWIDLGYSGADTGSAVSQTGGRTSYQSRHFIKADVGAGAANFSPRGIVIINHNISGGGTAKIQTAATDSWSGVTYDTLAGDSTIRIVYPAGAGSQWSRLVINDCENNTAGYAEVGIWFVGTYTQPSVTYSIGWRKRWIEFSTATLGTHGALWQDQRPRLGGYTLNWSEIPAADQAIIEAAAAACPMGEALFLALDAGVTDTNTIYGYFEVGVEVEGANTVYFNIGIAFTEAGG